MNFDINQYEYYNYVYNIHKKEIIYKPRLLELDGYSISNEYIQKFLEQGTEKDKVIQGIELLENGHNYIFDGENITKKIKLNVPESTSLKDFKPSELREDIFNIIHNHYNNKEIDLVISGGVDSSLLLAVLAEADWLKKVRVWTTKTPDGNDYYFAKKSADSVGVELNTVEVSYQSEFDFNILKESANLNLGPANIGVIPLSLVANSVKDMGGTCLMNGIAGETVSLNIYKSLEESYLQSLYINRRYIKLFKQILNLKKIKRKDIFSVLSGYSYPTNHSVNYSHMYHLCCGTIKGDTNRVRNNIEVSGIDSFTPYFNKALDKYMLMEMDSRFNQKITKITSRLAMKDIISDEVVWRKDDQGLRWDPKKYIRFHKTETDNLIDKYFGNMKKVSLLEVNAKYIRYLEIASLYALTTDK